MSLKAVKYNTPEMGAGRKVVNLPLTHTINQISLIGNFGVDVDPSLAQWPTYLTRIELLLDGHVASTISAQKYIDWLSRHGQTAVAGVLPLFFDRPWEDVLELRDHFKLGTLDRESVQLALTFADGVVINDFEMRGLVSANTNTGQLAVFNERPITIAAAGQTDFDGLPSGPSSNYGTMGLHFDFDTITDIEIRIGADAVDETSDAFRKQIDLNNAVTSVAGYTHLDFARRGDVREVFAMNQKDIILRLTTTNAPGQQIILHEYVQDFSANRRAFA